MVAAGLEGAAPALTGKAGAWAPGQEAQWPSEDDNGDKDDKDDNGDNGDDDDARAPACEQCERDAQEGRHVAAAGDELDRASAQNLDSGYAWLILVVMFLLQSSISGASRVYGIVYAKEVATGYYDREQASWPIATASAVENLAGILTPALASFLSWRKIELLSTILFITANLLAYFSDSLTVDILALGLIQGLALSTCTVLSLVINNDYFEHYRTTAYGIQMSGSTFGVLYLSPLVSWLLAEYDNFRVVYLALAIVFCGNIFLVLFIKPRAKTISRQRRQAESPRQTLTAATAAAKAKAKLALSRAGEIEHGAGELARVKKVLESLDSGEQLKAGLAKQQREPLSRKISRFESRFERKSSIASISYRARSRRQSILSRQHVPVAACASAGAGPEKGSAAASNCVYIIDGAANGGQQWPPLAAVHTNMIVKSKSGIELAGRLGSAERLASSVASAAAALADCEAQPRRQRISLDQAHSNPMMGADHQSSRKLADLSRQRSKLSVTNSLGGSSNNHLQRTQSALGEPGSGGGGGGGGGSGDALAWNAQDTCGATCEGRDDNAGSDSAKCCEYGRPRLNVADLEGGGGGGVASAAGEQHDLSSPAMLLQSKQQYLVDCATHSNAAANDSAKSARLPDGRRGFTLEQTVGLLKLPYLHCTWMMLALYYLIARVFVIILVDFADDHGFSMSESTNLLNYWSMGELFGRVLLGPFIDLQYMSCKHCIVLTCSLLATCIVSMVLVESYIIYALCSMCIAALISLEYMLINVLMVEYVGKEHVTNCYSLAACLSSLVLFARPSLIGLFRDHLGSYDGLLLLLASVTIAFAIVFYALEPILVRKWPKRQQATSIR